MKWIRIKWHKWQVKRNYEWYYYWANLAETINPNLMDYKLKLEKHLAILKIIDPNYLKTTERNK